MYHRRVSLRNITIRKDHPLRVLVSTLLFVLPATVEGRRNRLDFDDGDDNGGSLPVLQLVQRLDRPVR